MDTPINAGPLTDQQLHDRGLNPFAVKLVVESFLPIQEAVPHGVSFVYECRDGKTSTAGRPVRITIVPEPS